MSILLGCGGGAALAQDVISPGENKDGTIQIGKTNVYSFTATTGDRLGLQIAKLTGGAGFSPMIQVFAPSGARVAAKSGLIAVRVDGHATESGAYSVAVSDANRTGAGTFRMQLVRLPGTMTIPANDEGGPLKNGEVQTGTVDIGDFDPWTVEAKAGDRLVLQIAKVSGGAGFTPMLELFGPDGARVAFDSGATVARVDLQAVVAGTYTVLVSDVSPSGTGGYELRLAHLPAEFTVPAGDEGGVLPDANDKEGEITVGDLDLWSVAVNSQSFVRLQLTKMAGGAGFSPRLEVFAPDGQRKAVNQDAAGPSVTFASENGGVYTVMVSDGTRSGSGSYRLRSVQNSLPVLAFPTLTSGSTLLSEIAAAREDDQYSFIASAGEFIVLRVGETTTGSRLSPQVRLFDPSGAQLASQATAVAADVAVRATNSGVFTVSVRDNGGGANTGGYRLSFVKTGSAQVISPNDEGGALTNGVTHTGSIEVGDIDAYTFTANSGENIVVRMGELTTSLLPQLRLFDPTGVQIDIQAANAATEVAARATNSGTFLVVVGDQTSSWAGTGNYRLTMAKTGSPVTISQNDEGGPLANGSTHLGSIELGDMDAYTINANAGDSIVVRMGEMASSTLTPELRIFDPSGVLVDSQAANVASEVAVRATNSGAFLVIAADRTAGWAGTGNYRLTLAKTGTPLSITANDEGGAVTNGVTYLGSIETGDIDAWVINANTGENIVVRMGEATSGLTPELRIYDPSGALVDSQASTVATEVAVRATNSGPFLIIAGDRTAGWAGTGNYRLSLAKTGSPVTISAQDEGGPMVNGTTYQGLIEVGDIDAWTVDAKAGETIVVRMGEVSASTLTPELRLFDPSGPLLISFASTAAAEVSVRATNSGPFLIIAGDRTSGWAGSGNYRIVLAKTGTPIVPASSEEGGRMNGSGTYEGNLEVGALDAWSFSACAGDAVTLNVRELVNTSSLTPWIRLLGRDGVELRSVSAAGNVDVSIAAPASGTYTVIIGDRTAGYAGSGGYRLTVNGLSDALKICLPRTRADGFAPTIIGGLPGGAFTVLTSTNVNAVRSEWTTALTSQFDEFGVFTLTGTYDALELQRYFRVRTP